MAVTQIMNPDVTFIRDIKKSGGDTLKKCYQCATCSVVCNLSPDTDPFPRREMILANWGQSDHLLNDPNLWLCHQCNDCTTYCPRGARPGDVLAAIRAYAYRHFAFPSFMGKALASPSALPILLLIPALILFGCIFMFAPHTADGGFVFMQSKVVDFNLFLPHSSVDALFVFGNILIFLFAAIGFIRFWKGLAKPGEARKMSFISGLIATVKEIISHSRFQKCEANNTRTVWHMILFYGFLGAMATTGMIFLSIFIPHYLSEWGLASLSPYFELPIEFPNPIKIVGALSGIALVIGGGMLVVRRIGRKDEVGANAYSDYLFLYMIFFTGLTGVLSWLIRVADVAMLAYVIYFLHLVCVFFILWYMPYSKFAHMIFRTLALVHARITGRIQ